MDLRFALHGGDAYELLFTAPKRTRVPATLGGVKITAIGEITGDKSIFLLQRSGKRTELKPQGWEYFRTVNFIGKSPRQQTQIT